ncbi:MAG: hypothetical protein ACYS4W_04930 [Planctomycetota bacterium]|jgi:hypothetical protein
MKLAVFVVLGLVVTVTVYFVVDFWILESFLPGFTHTAATLGVAWLIVMPVALLLGSILTGYLSYPTMNTRLGLIAIAPGLYLAGLTIIPSLCSTILVDMLIIGSFWYVVSLAGAALGYFLRSLTKRHRLQSS